MTVVWKFYHNFSLVRWSSLPIHSKKANISLVSVHTFEKVGSDVLNILKSDNCYMLLLLSHSSRVWLCATPETAPHQVPRPWNSPGKNTRVGCHFLLQCMTVKSESEVAHSCPTLSNPMDCSLPGSSVHRIFQARVLEWVAIAFSVFTF